MKKAALVVLALVIVMGSIGCFGPRKITRGLDDILNQEYVNQPWLVGNVVSMWFIGIAFWFTQVVDAFIDFYYFWFEDAWPIGKGVGTPFNHKSIMLPAGK